MAPKAEGHPEAKTEGGVTQADGSHREMQTVMSREPRWGAARQMLASQSPAPLILSPFSPPPGVPIPTFLPARLPGGLAS